MLSLVASWFNPKAVQMGNTEAEFRHQSVRNMYLRKRIRSTNSFDPMLLQSERANKVTSQTKPY